MKRLRFVLLVVAGMLGCAVTSRANDGAVDHENVTRTVLEFRSRRYFATDQAYGQYVQKTLAAGWRVRAAVDYGLVKKGMLGTYHGTNKGEPPCLVIWDQDIKSVSLLLPTVPPDKARHVYWVQWHQIEIVGRKE
jgi:Mouse development and cellular proliferation protein Cullin-7